MLAVTMRRMQRIVIVLLWCVATACASSPGVQATPGGHRAPRVVQRVEPEYPAELRQQRVTGSVDIAGTVPKEGGVLRNPHVVRSDDPRLDQYALDAVRQWIWSAGFQNGVAVDVEFKTTVTFSVD